MKKELIEFIKQHIKHTHNKKDLEDLNTFSIDELKEIESDIMDFYFGAEFMKSKNKGTLKEYKQ